MYRRHPLADLFNKSHSDLGLALSSGQKHAEYLPLLKKANNDARLFDVMRHNWGDPTC